MRDANEPAVEIFTSNAKYLYWTPEQMIAHHTINGCNLQPGDLIGTGTISGPSPAELSSMLEFTNGGSKPITLPNGERRAFLKDGDEVTSPRQMQSTRIRVNRIRVLRGSIEASRMVGDGKRSR